MPESVKIYFSDEVIPVKEEVDYLLKILIHPFKNTRLIAISAPDDSTVTVGTSPNNTFQINRSFIQGTLSAELLNEKCFIQNDTGEPDYISTAFFMLTTGQEVKDNDPDIHGRFKYSNSYQYKFHNNKENIVQECLSQLRRKLGLAAADEPSSFFLSHDIDMVNGAIIEDGFYVLKKGRVDIFLSLLMHVAIGRPDWLNMDKIMSLESEYDCKSTFFWLVNRGAISKREKNADYDFNSPAIQKRFKAVESAGFENGIHKSISPEPFREEFSKYGSTPISNRYHYLKFKLPQAFEDIDASGLKLDASLGFAEEPGFRNSYGLPYNPYDFKNRRPFGFVEAPLHVMDRTYFQYKKFSVKEAEADLIAFFERHKLNCVISVLWHNNFFSNYKFKGYLDLYKAILAYIYENHFKTINPKEIVSKYSIV